MFLRKLLCALLLLGVAFCLPVSVMAQTITVTYQDTSGVYQFGTLDLTTGIMTAITSNPDNSDFPITGLAYTPDGTLYASESLEGTVGILVTRDPITGDFTEVGPYTGVVGAPFNVGGNLAANSNGSIASIGELFEGYDLGSNLAYTDTTTGTPTQQGPANHNLLTLNFGNLVYGPNGTLYYLISGPVEDFTTPGLYTVNPTNGKFTLVFTGTEFSDYWITGLITVGKTIYGFANTEEPGNVNDITYIVTIDPVAKKICPTGVTLSGAEFLFAAAYAAP